MLLVSRKSRYEISYRRNFGQIGDLRQEQQSLGFLNKKK